MTLSSMSDSVTDSTLGSFTPPDPENGFLLVKLIQSRLSPLPEPPDSITVPVLLLPLEPTHRLFDEMPERDAARSKELEKIKPLVNICGITSANDTIMVVEAGANSVGMFMWPNSKRSVSISVAKEISKAERDYEKDRGLKKMTTYTLDFLNLAHGVWAEERGDKNAGDGVVIGVIDSGINPLHPSFDSQTFSTNISYFSGA
ncbi:hypothetical protein RYX36_029392 [Vicia faba]